MPRIRGASLAEHRVATRARVFAAFAGLMTQRGFDAITMVLCLVLLRMESDPALIEPSARLTELFVNDMDGQLRESGVGDLVVGKHMGKLMGALGGRLGAYREGLAAEGDSQLAEAIARNVTLRDDADSAATVPLLRELAERLADRDSASLMAGAITG